MTNDFTYNMSEINEEEIMKGWELLKSEEGQEFWVNNITGSSLDLEEEGEEDYIPGLDDGEWAEYDEDMDFDVYGEEEFA